MASPEIYVNDLSITEEDYRALDYKGKVKHHMRVALGLRNSVGGIAMRASKDELKAFKQKEHIGPDGKPYDVHPYDMLRDQVKECLAAQGIYEPTKQEAEPLQAA
jgi:hypothetical protein